MSKKTEGKQKGSKKSENVNKKKVNSEKSNCCSIISFVILISLSYAAFKGYESFTLVLEIPEMDFQAWWGPNDTKINQDTSIRPFRIVFSDSMLADLRRRFDDYRRLKKTKSFEGAAWSYGVNSEAFAQFFSYWIFKYDFAGRERHLNKFDHFKTNIQGLDVHYIHVKPTVTRNVKVVPLMLLHGWPGSFTEFYEVIPKLTTVRKDYDFVFELIIPSLPGFGFSDASVKAGFSSAHIAVVLRNLMHRIGHKQFYIQGGDIGKMIAEDLVTLFPSEVLGFHTNMAVVLNKASLITWILGDIYPSFVEKEYTDRMFPFREKLMTYIEETGYHHVQSTKPDTIGVALNESPAGLAAYILEKFVTATNPDKRYTEDGGLDVFDKDDLLDNIMVYWTTGSMTTAMRWYKEKTVQNVLQSAILNTPTTVPTWALRLKYEIFFMPEFILKWKYTNLLGTTTFDFGGHFAALEQPDVFAEDVWLAVKNFRTFHAMKDI